MTCDELRAVAAEVALEQLTGSERAAALGHLASCPECRAVVTELATVADSLLLLAPSVEPPSGFESRVLGRLDGAQPARRSARGGIAAALMAAAAIGAVVGFSVAGDDDRAVLPVAAELRNARGEAAGNILLADDPDRMTCVFEDEKFGGAYEVEVVLADGSVASVGSFRSDGAPWTWTARLSVDVADVRTVRVLDDDGVVRITARLES